jgi:hypothetical protein
LSLFWIVAICSSRNAIFNFNCWISLWSALTYYYTSLLYNHWELMKSVGSHGNLSGTVPVRGGVCTQPSLGSHDSDLKLILRTLTWVNKLGLNGFSPWADHMRLQRSVG